jgi:hypothetical protein
MFLFFVSCSVVVVVSWWLGLVDLVDRWIDGNRCVGSVFVVSPR